MDSTILKHLENNKAKLVFEKGTDAEKLKFCKDYVTKNDPANKLTPDNKLDHMIYDVIPINTKFSVDRVSRELYDRGQYQDYLTMTIKNSIYDSAKYIMDNLYIKKEHSYSEDGTYYYTRYYLTKMKHPPHTYIELSKMDFS